MVGVGSVVGLSEVVGFSEVGSEVVGFSVVGFSEVGFSEVGGRRVFVVVGVSSDGHRVTCAAGCRLRLHQNGEPDLCKLQRGFPPIRNGYSN